MVTLSELRDRLLELPQVQDAEIEGEAPSWLRIEVGIDDDVDYVMSLCLMLDRQARRRADSRTIVVEDDY